MKKVTFPDGHISWIACACGGLSNHEYKDEKGNWIITCKCGCHEKGHDLEVEWYSDTLGKWLRYDEVNPLSLPL